MVHFMLKKLKHSLPSNPGSVTGKGKEASAVHHISLCIQIKDDKMTPWL